MDGQLKPILQVAAGEPAFMRRIPWSAPEAVAVAAGKTVLHIEPSEGPDWV